MLAVLRTVLQGCILSAVTFAQANPVLDFNDLMLQAIRLDNSAPTLSSRNLAMMHTAVYDAVNSVAGGYQPYAFEIEAPEGSSAIAAAAGAAFECLTILYPAVRPQAEELLLQYSEEGSAAAGFAEGLQIGRQVAFLTLEARKGDGAATDVPYIPGELPGDWRRTPPFFRPPTAPGWRYVELFAVEDDEMFLPGPPPALNSPEYAAALNEVKRLGGASSDSRTAKESEIAVFWSDFSYTSTPPGHWQQIAGELAREHVFSLEECARLFALLTIAQADAAILCWESKYRYDLWRPVTAIQRADEDGNPLTTVDREWVSFLATPSFPTYVSGHSMFSHASAEVLANFFGSDLVSFTARSDSLPGVTRQYESFSQCAKEIGMSRIYGGIHFSFDNLEGARSGKNIGRYVSANWLLPKSDLPKATITRSGSTTMVRVHGEPGESYTVEVSSNLTEWNQVGTVTAPGGVKVPYPGDAGSKQFFRIVPAVEGSN